MPENLIILFAIIPLTAGLLSVLLVNSATLSRVIGSISLLSTLVLAVVGLVAVQGQPGAHSVLVSQMGGWPAPFGISIVFDSLAGLLLATASMVALGSYIHSFTSLSPQTERRYFHPLIQLLMFGVNLSFLTGDLFNLFVAFEIMLMASYALLAIGGSRRQLTQAYKYVLLNVLASTVFLMAAGMVYGMLGTLNLAHMAQIVHTHQETGTDLPTGFTAVAVTLLIVFGLKGAFFPLWFWLPDTYYTTPIAVAGLFGGMLTKVGVYAVVRTFPLVFAVPDQTRHLIGPIIAVSAGFTMFLGVLGAVSQHEIRRILSIHVISQVGYMVFGIAVGVGAYQAAPEGDRSVAAAALAGCIFYMIQHMVVKCSLFLCCGVIEKHRGTDDLDKLGGLLQRDGWLALLFFIASMSLVGLPPLSGFFGKLTIIQTGWHNYWALSIVGLATGLLTLLSMLKIWSYAFWNPSQMPADDHEPTPRRQMIPAYFGTGLLVATALFLGFGAGPVYEAAFQAGRQLDDPSAYIQAVLDPAVLEEFKALHASQDASHDSIVAPGEASAAPTPAEAPHAALAAEEASP